MRSLERGTGQRLERGSVIMMWHGDKGKWGGQTDVQAGGQRLREEVRGRAAERGKG